MRKITKFILTAVLSAVPAGVSAGLDAEKEFFSLERASLEETLDIKTSVASMASLKLRETPGLVTVITREEIQASGARDLVDVLRMVPELEFGADSYGTIGLGVRGNWANEGKALLLWDGQTYNESLYTTVQYERFPVDQIEQIEIIKGPGSVIYGGYAALAVINIKTRTPSAMRGREVYAGYGQGAKARARENAGYSYGDIVNGTEISAKASWGEAQRSDRRYTDFYGTSYNMNRASDLRQKNLNIYAARNGASLRLIVDDYSLWEADGYGTVLASGTESIGFPAVFAETKYVLRLSESLRLEPRLNYTRAEPWLENSVYGVYDKRTQRVTGGATAFYDHCPGVSFIAGSEYYHDSVKLADRTVEAVSAYADGRRSAAYDNIAFFGQGAFDLGPADLTAGARYDRHSQSGISFVPRLALTHVWEKFNFKAIYSQSYRAPSIENLRINPEIKPERTRSFELEAGHKAGDTLFIYGNVFQTAIKKPIVYYADPATLVETYRNFERTGTAGFGLGLKFKRNARRADLNYVYYAARSNRTGAYAVPGHGSYLLGMPKHKVTFSASLPAGGGFSVNPSAIYTSIRYGYADAGGPKEFGEVVTANLNLQLKDRPVKRLTLNLGARDIFNSGFSYLQPYASGHAPLPAQAREIFFKAGYEF